MNKYKLINNTLGWIVAFIATCVYLMTMEPTASFWDCGEFISSAFKLEVGHPPGAPFFMLTGNLFSQFASDPSTVAKMVNTMSAICSGMTILFLFWSITHMVKKIVVDDNQEITLSQIITTMGAGVVGALAYTFSDTFWFSAVEGEVYAYSSLFTALVFWLILKWEEVADAPHADRWIVLIAYLMGLSIGVHLLNLLCIPAIVLVYYYKKFPNPTLKGTLISLLISFAIVGIMLYGIVQGLIEICGYFELFFVNTLGMPYNTGVYAYAIVLTSVLIWSIFETMRDAINPIRLKISFLLSIILIGIPFIGDNYLVPIFLVAALGAFLYMNKSINIKLINTILTCLMVIVVGYSSYALILIRATADTPMNQNAPKDIFTLRTYLAREQYGQTPLFYGKTYVSEVARKNEGGTCVAITEEGSPVWTRVSKKDPNEKDRYYVSRHNTVYKYVDELNMLFPRMHSEDSRHIEAYKEWANIKGQPVKYNQCGETKSVMKPTFAENLRFFFSYQLNFMYWRYFMWNFSGRQNDIQGHGGINKGNWITGIKAIDTILVGPQDDLPSDIADNKGHNVYFMLPLLLGLIGLFYQVYAGNKGVQGFWITFMLFFMTGIAIVLYLNQTPYQPRERDYAYAGSFYAFCIWIGFGVVGLVKLLEKYAKLPSMAAATIAAVAALMIPIQMAAQNWDDHDRSGRYVCRDFGANYLESCEPNAVIFTNGDNDTFPLWYAQEVEGIRTDVRVCNTSYLQTDWYADQMRKQAYNSAPLPISWDHDVYVQGKRDFAYIFPMTDGGIDLNTALEFVRSDDPKFKKIPNFSQAIDYIPSDKLIYRVDSTALAKNGLLKDMDVPQPAKEMVIDLKGKDALGKQELLILNMLQTNNWQRPMYFAITVSPDQFVKLDPYFQQTGMAYQIVPMKVKGTTKSINADKMYDNVMNKFKWGGVNKPGVYLDENVMRMCKSYRMIIFGKLAAILAHEGKNDKALKLLDKCMEVLPPENVPMDYSALAIGEFYYKLGEKEKGHNVLKAIADNSLRSLNWFFRLNSNQFASVADDVNENLYVLQEVIQLTKDNDPELMKLYKEEFDNFRMALASLKKE